MTKRAFDFLTAAFALVVLSPILAIFCFLIWIQDWRSPFYVASRVGKDGIPFQMVKLRSMVVDAGRSGVTSTSANDARITTLGHIIRRYKLDELAELWNVLLGDMSLVGPRPQVQSGVDAYTSVERRLLSVRPGLTDFASIVFSDEGEILRGSENPDRRYDEIIRPWKSRLALLYVDHRTMWLDLQLIWLTVICITSREDALRRIGKILNSLGADPLLLRMAIRSEPLLAYPPPGAN